MENDKLTQLYINTKNISALVQQLKIIQAEQQVNIDKLHIQSQQIAMLNSEIANLKQQFFVMKALFMGHGSTVI
jgi:hypothetical protein